jgi:hypothetical protein
MLGQSSKRYVDLAAKIENLSYRREEREAHLELGWQIGLRYPVVGIGWVEVAWTLGIDWVRVPSSVSIGYVGCGRTGQT